MRDISQLKAHEAILKQKNEALTDLNHALDRFVYSISHDLRAPIASALGLIEITRFENDPVKIRHYLDLQAKSLRKLDSYIGNIMDFSRNERTAITCERVNFQALIDTIFKLYSYSENLPKIRKEISITEHAPCFSDEKRLTVVLNHTTVQR